MNSISNSKILPLSINLDQRKMYRFHIIGFNARKTRNLVKQGNFPREEKVKRKLTGFETLEHSDLLLNGNGFVNFIAYSFNKFQEKKKNERTKKRD